MTRIVQAADIKGQLDGHRPALGLQLISRGFPLVTHDDHETAERAAFVYDALYANIKEDQVPQVIMMIATEERQAFRLRRRWLSGLGSHSRKLEA